MIPIPKLRCLRRHCAARVPACALLQTCALLSGAPLAGCVTSLGPAVSQSLHAEHATYVGASGSALLDMPVFDIDANLAVGVQSQILNRLGARTRAADWRVQVLAGLSHMPRPYEMRAGYELYATPGMARYTEGSDSHLSVAWGVLGGMPIRLSRAQQPWRSDHLVGANFYVVPALGATVLGVERVELTGSLSLRLAFWSAITP